MLGVSAYVLYIYIGKHVVYVMKMSSNTHVCYPRHIPNTYTQHIWTSLNEVYVLGNRVYILGIYIGQHVTHVVQHIYTVPKIYTRYIYPTYMWTCTNGVCVLDNSYIYWVTMYIYWVHMLSNIYGCNPIHIPDTSAQHIWTNLNETYVLDNSTYILDIYIGQHVTHVVQYICM